MRRKPFKPFHCIFCNYPVPAAKKCTIYIKKNRLWVMWYAESWIRVKKNQFWNLLVTIRQITATFFSCTCCAVFAWNTGITAAHRTICLCKKAVCAFACICFIMFKPCFKIFIYPRKYPGFFFCIPAF